MTNRFLMFIGAAALSVVSLLPVLAAGQAPTATGKTTGGTSRAPLRTPWGEPALEGIWSVVADVPLERPEEYAGREFLTDEEIAALDKKKSEDPGRNARAELGTDRDVGGAYNAVFNSVLKTGRRTSLVVDPPDGKIPPLTPEAQKRVDMERAYRSAPATAPNPGTYSTACPGCVLNRPAEGPEDVDLNDRCLGSMLPDFGGGAFADGTTIRIGQSPNHVAIYYEHNHGGGANRIIPIDGSGHLPAHMGQWLGDARARWEGNTLVVDTTNFTDHTDFRGSRENLHLIERYTRVDANTLRREITIDDPTTWTRPWTVVIELGKGDDKQNRIFELACHEGNFGMTGILSGARAQEKAAPKATGKEPK